MICWCWEYAHFMIMNYNYKWIDCYLCQADKRSGTIPGGHLYLYYVTLITWTQVYMIIEVVPHEY